MEDPTQNTPESEPEETEEQIEHDEGLYIAPPDGSVIFSGMQPTGELHIGNYLGAAKNWVALQHRYQAIFCIVDLHALTIPYDPEEMPKRIFDMAVGFLACGLDPERIKLFVQSQVPEHTQLAWVLGTVTPMGDLNRMTQFKEKSAQHQKNVNSGLFTYPVLQAADILLYRALGVPVGEDQVQHIELCRAIVQRFNARFGETFKKPSALLTPTPRVMGLPDGKAKMSKSRGNALLLSASREEIWEKLRPAATDPARIRRTDPGNPEKCNIGHLHKAFSSPEVNQKVYEGCTTAGIGCIDCKKWLLESMVEELTPIQEREQAFRQKPDQVRDILAQGARDCRKIAREVMGEVEEKLGIPGGRFSA